VVYDGSAVSVVTSATIRGLVSQ
jgi:predicted RNA-binding protein with TRAM domain